MPTQPDPHVSRSGPVNDRNTPLESKIDRTPGPYHTDHRRHSHHRELGDLARRIQLQPHAPRMHEREKGLVAEADSVVARV